MARSRVRTRILAAAVTLPLGVACASVADAAPVARAPCVFNSSLRLNSFGADVVCLESTLHDAGFTAVAGPDWYFGPSTDAAVRAFQGVAGLTVDGVVGPRTRAALAATPAAGASVPAKVIESRPIGSSVEGRPIIADRMGTPGGRVVLIIGIIHGDETKGALVTQLMRTLPTPAGVDLWLIDSINPDGHAGGTRENANGVDLNRNFEAGWNYIPKSSTNHQYSGEQPADQPETQAVEAFIRDIKPAIGIWYHQDANVITVSGTRHEIPTAYGKLVGLGTGNVPCSQMCTGTASTFANQTIAGSTNFLVELPGSSKVTPAMIQRHAFAVLAVSVL